MILKEWLESKNYTAGYTEWYYLKRLLHHKILKEFKMSSLKPKDKCPWVSWLEFGKHKNVKAWVLIEGGYAIGFNENPAKGYSFPKVQLSNEQVQKYLSHNLTYE